MSTFREIKEGTKDQDKRRFFQEATDHFKQGCDSLEKLIKIEKTSIRPDSFIVKRVGRLLEEIEKQKKELDNIRKITGNF